MDYIDAKAGVGWWHGNVTYWSGLPIERPTNIHTELHLRISRQGLSRYITPSAPRPEQARASAQGSQRLSACALPNSLQMAFQQAVIILTNYSYGLETA
jgi:hypothetical protein